MVHEKQGQIREIMSNTMQAPGANTDKYKSVEGHQGGDLSWELGEIKYQSVA